MTKRAEAYGMDSMTSTARTSRRCSRPPEGAQARARDGKGPGFVVADCVRLSGHYVGDPQVYRPKEEILELRKSRDPIELLRARLELSDEEFEEMDREATHRRGLGRVREEGHRSEAGRRPQERLCLSSPTARRFATR